MSFPAAHLRPSIIALAVSAFAAAAVLPATACAQAADTRNFSVAAGSLEDALNRFGRAAGITLSYAPDLTANLRSAGLQGSHTVDGGFTQLLAGSGLEAVRQPNGSYSLRRKSESQAGDARLHEIEVMAAADRLPPAAPGGQVARGARRGVLGNLDVMDTPFNVTSYTAQLIENQQARGLMDVLESDPSVRSSSPIDSEGDIVMVRGF